jgi:hypothetical protein
VWSNFIVEHKNQSFDTNNKKEWAYINLGAVVTL